MSSFLLAPSKNFFRKFSETNLLIYERKRLGSRINTEFEGFPSEKICDNLRVEIIEKGGIIMSRNLIPDGERIQIPLEVSRSVLYKLSMNTADFYKPLTQELYKLRNVGVSIERIEQAISDITVVVMWFHSQIAQILYDLLLKREPEEKAS